MTHAMPLPTALYREQAETWRSAGQHILAQFDDETIIVYQAYSPRIGRFAAGHGCFGGDFKYSRMSWIKPNFLWMMYRSDWGRSEGQQVVLAIRLRRSFFDALLAQAVPSSFHQSQFNDEAAWKKGVEQSNVRLQWDPDHLPTGEPTARRAIQLGLRGSVLEAYGKREAIEILDVSEFVAEQRTHVGSWRTADLSTPMEEVYLPCDSQVAERIGLAL